MNIPSIYSESEVEIDGKFFKYENGVIYWIRGGFTNGEFVAKWLKACDQTGCKHSLYGKAAKFFINKYSL